MTNLDFVFEDYLNKRLMLVEEKQNNGRLGSAQGKTFEIIHRALNLACAMDAGALGYDYWGMYVLKMPGTMPGPGMMLNDKSVTCEELVAHLNFEKKHCEGLFPRVKYEKTGNGFRITVNPNESRDRTG